METTSCSNEPLVTKLFAKAELSETSDAKLKVRKDSFI
ncbi:hypothetical protein PCIT_a1534 [Pseudoalteromonas citrea]|uniref:Uncharacterized protein n=1 Tax=Pseudoalteromonas citrea TaxID=43655 RepID=A0AAD4AMP9_9GAMM|nr:hypothetical protein PCIT_a1534 [Pseudoalteromonas citrea]